MRRLIISIAALAAVAVVLCSIPLDARPNRYGHSDREERHMLPTVSAGQQDPAWSPDGRWIAFSMRGDIWKIPAQGREAIALTSGPAYYFEPAWSPDSARIAFAFQATGNLDIGIVSANGGPVETVASHERVDIQPAWSRDGKSLFFVSARSGAFRIFRHDFAANADTAVTNGIQPAVSPDGKLLAYEQSGLRVLDLATGESRMVRDQETEYRMEPAWTPDGQNILYVTEDEGSNDIRIVSASGGDAIELTNDTTHHEMSPSVSPDGTMLMMTRASRDDLGVPLDDGVAAKEWRDRFYHPDDREAMQAGVHRTLSESVRHEGEARIRRHDGHYRWFLVRHEALRDDQGQVIRLFATATDIDDRKQAEDRVREENLVLREEVDKASMFEEIVGVSTPIRSVLAQVSRVAPTDSTVLITGETGTGKELVARTIHKRSPRSARAFVGVNCAAMAPSLIASELFGHEKGAFSGAQGRPQSWQGGVFWTRSAASERKFERVRRQVSASAAVALHGR